jgi:hypothetical protein
MPSKGPVRAAVARSSTRAWTKRTDGGHGFAQARASIWAEASIAAISAYGAAASKAAVEGYRDRPE